VITPADGKQVWKPPAGYDRNSSPLLLFVAISIIAMCSAYRVVSGYPVFGYRNNNFMNVPDSPCRLAAVLTWIVTRNWGADHKEF
jgi:hypothetical protein